MLFIFFLFQIRGVVVEQQANPNLETPGSYYHALLIGISKYQTQSHLKTPVNDIEDLGLLLKSRYGFDSVKILKDNEATKSNIENEILSLVTKPYGESFLIYYAGHGTEGADRSGYWIPWDGIYGNMSSYVSNQMVLEKIKKSSIKHVLLVSDSCFSGTFLSNPNMENRLQISRWYETHSRWVITSGDLVKVDDIGPNGRNSRFAYYFLEELRQNKQAYLLPRNLISSMREHAKDDPKMKFQVPKCQLIASTEEAQFGSFIFWDREQRNQDKRPYPHPANGDIKSLEQSYLNLLKGRKVWVTGHGINLCNQLEQLGLLVDCDLDHPTNLHRTISTNCPEISYEELEVLRMQLNLSNFKIVHIEDNENMVENECYESYEITIRI